MSLTDFGADIVKLLPPEAAHKATIRALKLGLGLPLRAPVALCRGRPAASQMGSEPGRAAVPASL